LFSAEHSGMSATATSASRHSRTNL
jgi:hypothetical protein